MTAVSEDHERVVVLKLTGECSNPKSVEVMRELLGEYIHDGKTRIIVDLGDVSLIGYQGLGTLVERLRQARSRGGDLKLCRPSTYVRKMFEMVGAEQVFDTYDSELAALASFGM